MVVLPVEDALANIIDYLMIKLNSKFKLKFIYFLTRIIIKINNKKK